MSGLSEQVESIKKEESLWSYLSRLSKHVMYVKKEESWWTKSSRISGSGKVCQKDESLWSGLSRLAEQIKLTNFLWTGGLAGAGEVYQERRNKTCGNEYQDTSRILEEVKYIKKEEGNLMAQIFQQQNYNMKSRIY